MSTLESHPRWFIPFLYFAIAVQAAFSLYYYQSGEIGSTITGLFIVVLLVLALWGAKVSRS